MQVLRDALDPASLFVVLMLAGEAFRPFRELAGHWHAGFLGVSAAASVEELERAPLLVRDPQSPLPLPGGGVPLIAFECVRFTYSGRARPP